jgi:DNA-binding transcriptional LysR family regulator
VSPVPECDESLAAASHKRAFDFAPSKGVTTALQDNLFRRAWNGVVLTAEGQDFLHRVVPILDQLAEMEKGAWVAQAKDSSRILRVGGTISPSAVLLPKLLARTRQ